MSKKFIQECCSKLEPFGKVILAKFKRISNQIHWFDVTDHIFGMALSFLLWNTLDRWISRVHRWILSLWSMIFYRLPQRTGRCGCDWGGGTGGIWRGGISDDGRRSLGSLTKCFRLIKGDERSRHIGRRHDRILRNDTKPCPFSWRFWRTWIWRDRTFGHTSDFLVRWDPDSFLRRCWSWVLRYGLLIKVTDWRHVQFV